MTNGVVYAQGGRLQKLVMKNRKFTNTAIPVFSGTEGWYQHIHIVQAIVKSNGWPEETAALQLFVHLKGEVLNVALLLAKKEQESWTGLVEGLAAYYQSPGRFVKDFAKLADPLVQLTRKGVPFVWGSDQQSSFDALKACLLCAPILGFPTEDDQFVLDTDASLFAIGGVLSQIQNEEEVVIAYASRSLRTSQRRYCTTRREMLAAVVMCTHFRSYLRGSPFTLRTDHSSLRWLQKFKNEDGMLARWYLLLGQFSVTFEYRPGLLHNNADGMSRQCGQCKRPDCPVSAADLPTIDTDAQSALVDQPFATSEMGDSMDADLLQELSGETWVASAVLDELTVDLPATGADDELVSETAEDKILQTVRSWVDSGAAPQWVECAGLAPELRSWRLQVGNIRID